MKAESACSSFDSYSVQCRTSSCCRVDINRFAFHIITLLCLSKTQSTVTSKYMLKMVHTRFTWNLPQDGGERAGDSVHAEVIWKIQESENISALQTCVLWNTGDCEESKIIKWDKVIELFLCLSVTSSPSLHLCVCLSVSLPACPPVCPPVCSSIHIHGCLPVSIYLSACVCVYLSVCLSVHLCVHLSVCFHGCLPVSVCACLPLYICLFMSDNGSICLAVHQFLQVSVTHKVAFAWAQHAHGRWEYDMLSTDLEPH